MMFKNFKNDFFSYLFVIVELNNYKENFIDYLTADKILYFDISRDVRADVPNISKYLFHRKRLKNV